MYECLSDIHSHLVEDQKSNFSQSITFAISLTCHLGIVIITQMTFAAPSVGRHVAGKNGQNGNTPIMMHITGKIPSLSCCVFHSQPDHAEDYMFNFTRLLRGNSIWSEHRPSNIGCIHSVNSESFPQSLSSLQGTSWEWDTKTYHSWRKDHIHQIPSFTGSYLKYATTGTRSCTENILAKDQSTAQIHDLNTVWSVWWFKIFQETC